MTDGSTRKTLHAIAILLACLAIAPPPARALETVTLQLKWTHAFQFAGYYAAEAQGYFRAAGLDVRIKEATLGVDPVRDVIEGKAQYGVGTSSLLLARASGKPVVVLAVIFQHSPYEIYAAPEIRTLRDLVGKRLMIEPQAEELIAFLKKENVPPGRVRLVPHSFDAEGLMRGRAEAISGYISNEPYYFKRARYPYQTFSPRSSGIDFYGDNLFTSEGELRSHPARVKAFRAAALRGWQYAKDHRDEMITLIMSRYPGRHTRDFLNFEAGQMIPLLQPDLVEIGYINPHRWRHIADTYASIGLLRENYPLEGFIYSAKEVDMTWFYRGMAAALLLLLGISGVTLYIYRVNRRLAQTIKKNEQATAALTENEKHQRSLIENMLNGFAYCKMLFDAQGRPSDFINLEVNNSFARLTGVKAALGMPASELFPGLKEKHPDLFEVCGRVAMTGQPERFELNLETRNLYLSIAFYSVEQGYFAAVFENITERKRAEAAMREAMRAAQDAASAKSDFLANMSHEIRTPMTAILGMTELALDTTLTKEQHRYLKTVHNSANGLLLLLNDILDFSKIEAGQLEVESIPYDLEAAVEDSVDIFGAKAAAKGLELVSRVSPAVMGRLVGDPSRVRQVLINLVGNAVKFTEKGQVSVTAEAVVAEDGSKSLEFSVADTGIGIPEAKRDEIFKKFSQGDSSMTRKFGGTGLGLSISMALVRLMNGRIWLESQEDRGSTFYFSLPLIRPAGYKPAEVSALPGADQVQVLLTDDSPLTRLALREMFFFWGFLPRETSGGEEALSLLKQEPARFKLLILDYNMPGLNGLAVARALRGDPALRDIKIIFLAAAGAVSPELLAELGVEAIVSKPVKRGEMLEAMQKALGIAAPAPEAEASSEAPERKVARHQRVLLSEDNPDNQVLAVKFLEKAGYQVTVAANGLEAVKAFEAAHYDLILMDIQMPEMDGYAAAREIRSREAAMKYERIPMVALTANALTGDSEKSLAAGMDAHLTKPLNRKDLLEAAERWIDRRMKVLVADDSPDELRLTEVWLRERKDIRPHFARSGREALEKFGRYAFSLVLLDMEMPEMDGYTAAGLMRRAPVACSAAPILAITAHDGAAEVIKCLAAGCDECISKPLLKAKLFDVLDRYFADGENR